MDVRIIVKEGDTNFPPHPIHDINGFRQICLMIDRSTPIMTNWPLLISSRMMCKLRSSSNLLLRTDTEPCLRLHGTTLP